VAAPKKPAARKKTRSSPGSTRSRTETKASRAKSSRSSPKSRKPKARPKKKSPTGRRRRPGRGAMLLAGLGLALILGGLAAWLLRSEPPTPPPLALKESAKASVAAAPPPSAPSAPAQAAPPDYEERPSTFHRHLALTDAAIMSALRSVGLREEAVTFSRVRNVVQDGLHFERVEIGLNVAQANLARVEEALLSGLSRLGFPVSLTSAQAEDHEESLEVWLQGRLTHRLNLSSASPAPAGRRGRVAVIIDDLGYHPERDEAFLQLDLPLSLAVLPFGPVSRSLSQEGTQRGRDVLLHLPMEPKGFPGVYPGPGALLTSMGPEQLRQAFSQDLAAVPGVKGVNNHMGSKLTEDAERLKVILAECKRRGLFFVDSRTTPSSRVLEVARALDVKVAQRSVFLDNVPEKEAIRAQLRRLVAHAREEGQAIGIGHPHRQTLEALAEMNEELKSQTEPVPVSRLVR